MKKLISLLMILLLALTGVFALAEEPTDAPETPVETVETVETTETADGAEPTKEPSLIAKGLTVTGFGLAGVFLVLILFFLTIKVMGKLLK